MRLVTGAAWLGAIRSWSFNTVHFANSSSPCTSRSTVVSTSGDCSVVCGLKHLKYSHIISMNTFRFVCVCVFFFRRCIAFIYLFCFCIEMHAHITSSETPKQKRHKPNQQPKETFSMMSHDLPHCYEGPATTTTTYYHQQRQCGVNE